MKNRNPLNLIDSPEEILIFLIESERVNVSHQNFSIYTLSNANACKRCFISVFSKPGAMNVVGGYSMGKKLKTDP